MSDKVKEKAVAALIAAAIIPGGLVVLAGLAIINKFYKAINEEKKDKNATKTDSKR